MTENNKLQTIEQQLVQRNVSDNVLNKVRVLESQGNLNCQMIIHQVMP